MCVAYVVYKLVHVIKIECVDVFGLVLSYYGIERQSLLY